MIEAIETVLNWLRNRRRIVRHCSIEDVGRFWNPPMASQSVPLYEIAIWIKFQLNNEELLEFILENWSRLDVKLSQQLILIFWWSWEEKRIFYPELSTFAALSDWRITWIWCRLKTDSTYRRCRRVRRRWGPHPYDLMNPPPDKII